MYIAQVYGGAKWPHHKPPWFLAWNREHYCGVDFEHSKCVPFSSFHGAPEIGTVITAGLEVTVVSTYIAVCVVYCVVAGNL